MRRAGARRGDRGISGMRGRKRCTARKHDREPGEAGAAGVEAKFGAAATQVNARVRPPRARPESPPARQQRQCDWQRHIFTDLAPRLLRASRSRGAPPLLLMGLALVGARGALAPPRRAVCRPRRGRQSEVPLLGCTKSWTRTRGCRRQRAPARPDRHASRCRPWHQRRRPHLAAPCQRGPRTPRAHWSSRCIHRDQQRSSGHSLHGRQTRL